jgi:hypothetical protein
MTCTVYSLTIVTADPSNQTAGWNDAAASKNVQLFGTGHEFGGPTYFGGRTITAALRCALDVRCVLDPDKDTAVAPLDWPALTLQDTAEDLAHFERWGVGCPQLFGESAGG